MKFTSKDKGTLVIWSDHDKLDDDVIDVIEDFEIWVGRTYRKFIDKGLNIYINGNKVKTIDPSFLSLKNSRFPDDEPGELVQEITIDWPVDKSKAKKPGETAPIIIRITKISINV